MTTTTTTTTTSENETRSESCHNNTTSLSSSSLLFSPSLERKLEDITVSLKTECLNALHNNICSDNVLTIANYILSMRTETNLSDSYRRDNIKLLCTFSKYNDNKPFKTITREDIIAFLESFRRPEVTDPLHKWIGTYNLYLVILLRFFKWLYYPDIEPDKRPKPEVIENIPQLKRKEKSIYKPSDLWTAEDDFLFIKYCPSKRMKCYHAVAGDLACRPHEILKLKIKDISFKSIGDRQYAEVLVNGKTGTRPIPLIDSLPYVKDYLDHEHPQPGNPNAVFISGTGRSLGRELHIISLYKIYDNFKKVFFPKLLESANVPPEDKQKIRELLKKPFNPYIRRHSSLTQKSRILKESTLRIFAGWTVGSNMPQRYLHYFGNEACESILEACGIVNKDYQQMANALKSKQCPNCNEPNKPDSKFCAKCRMVLTYNAYTETLENQKEKEDELQTIKEQFNNMQSQLQTLITALGSIKDQTQINQTAQILYKSGILNSS